MYGYNIQDLMSVCICARAGICACTRVRERARTCVYACARA